MSQHALTRIRLILATRNRKKGEEMVRLLLPPWEPDLVLERLDNRYVVSQREIVHESDVLLTPYSDDQTIDSAALGSFIAGCPQ